MTLRELAWAAEGRQRAEWNRTAALLATVANVNRDQRRHPAPYEPEQFNPFARKEGRKQSVMRLDAEQSVKALAGVLGGKARERRAR